MKTFLAICLTFGLASAAPAQVRTTGDVRLDLFRDACVDGMAMRERIGAQGWSPASNASDPRLRDLLSAMGRIEAEADEDEAEVEPYSRAMEGRTFYLVLIDVQSAYAQLEGCVLYDFDATGALDPALLTRWLGAEPDKVDDQPGSILGHYWDLAGQDGLFGVNSAYVIRGGKGSQEAGFYGVALATTVRVSDPAQIVR